ncbi:MAG: PIN domain-containing protein [Clostridiales bacterium]|nr:PIN domain-containing protein [Clostridiales bacterium]
MKVLIDTNVMIDAITKRDGASSFSADVIAMCSSNRITGFAAPHSFSNMYYILRKEYSDKNRRIIINEYCKILDVVSMNEDVINAALNNNNITDFEDAIQYASAESVGADYIVTRNVKDYGRSSIKALSPEEFLRTTEKERAT